MIIDKIENIGRYAFLNPRFEQVAAFLKENDLNQMQKGKYVIDGDNLYVNVVESQPKTIKQAKLETHNKMVDIQILLSGTEQQLFCPRSILKEVPYNEQYDISFYTERAENALYLRPGYAVIYFPDDAHAPAICDQPIRKAIFKVKNQ